MQARQTAEEYRYPHFRRELLAEDAAFGDRVAFATL